jgi:hypothetical protein
MQAIKKDGRNAIKLGFDRVMDNNDLWNTFLGCSELKIPQTTKQTLYKELISKAYHARSGVVTDRFNKLYTGQFAANATGQSFRGGLMALTKKKSEEAARGAKRKLVAIQDGPAVSTVAKKN